MNIQIGVHTCLLIMPPVIEPVFAIIGSGLQSGVDCDLLARRRICTSAEDSW